jgi:hypothetical protein
VNDPITKFVSVFFIDDKGSAIVVDQKSSIEVKIEKSDTRDPDTAEVTLFNLSPTTEKRLVNETMQIEIRAGYTENPGQIFKGIIADAVSDRSEDGLDMALTIFAEDSKTKLRTATVSKTYSSGSPLAAAFQDLATNAEIPTDVSGVSGRMSDPFVFLGAPRDAIDALCKLYGFRNQVVSGRLYVVGKDSVISGASIPLLSKDTGLIGSPSSELVEKSKKTKRRQVHARSKLNAIYIPGSACELRTEARGSKKAPIKAVATYKIKRVQHVINSETMETGLVLEEYAGN